MPRAPGMEAGEIERGVFFIVGVPRSGTTILRKMLGAHPRMWVPNESEFFMRVPRTSDARELRRAFLVYAGSEQFAQQGVDAAELLEAIDSGRCVDRGSLFLEMMRLQAGRAGKARVGEKSPHHCRHVERIAQELPSAKFIHVSRDPRDVAASSVLTPWTCHSIVAHTKGWAAIQREHRRLMGVMEPERYTEVRFDRLVGSPETELRRLCGFLGEEFTPQMLLPLDRGAPGRFRERLALRQVRTVQRIAGAEMDRLECARVQTPERFAWTCADWAETCAIRVSRLGRSIRKRLGLVAGANGRAAAGAPVGYPQRSRAAPRPA